MTFCMPRFTLRLLVWVPAVALAAVLAPAKAAEPSSQYEDSSQITLEEIRESLHRNTNTVQLARVDASSAPRTKSAPSASAAPHKPLDLRTPDPARVFTPAQMREMLTVREEVNPDDVESVSVEGERNQPVYVPSGFHGIAWAVRHPTQAWRLFVPAPSN
jgi:hypothetical protein